MSAKFKEWVFQQNPALLDDNIRPDPEYDKGNDMKMTDMYQSTGDYLKAQDFKGKAKKLIISGIEMAEMSGKDDEPIKKPVVSFRGTDRKLVLNKTNGQAIAAMYGDETDDWMGKEVILYPTTTDFAGNTVPCIRVQVKMQVDELDEDLPF